MTNAPRYHRCCTAVQAEYFVAASAAVLLLATVGSPAPRSPASIVLLSLIIAASLLAAIVDWRADATLQGSLLERSSSSSKAASSRSILADYEDVRSGRGGTNFDRSRVDKFTDEDIEKQQGGSGGGSTSYRKMNDKSSDKRRAKKQPPEQDKEEFIKQVDAGLRPRRHVVVILFSSGIALFLLLMVRLVAGALHFRGYPPLLDFGPKYGNPSEDAEANIAFVLDDINSYGHCLQGILASMLAFPAVAGAIARVGVRGGEDAGNNNHRGVVYSAPRVWMLALVEALAACMSVYPSYNFLKRAIYHPDTFASSSFMNNGLEWAMGYILGLSLGMLSSSVVRRRLVSGYLLNPSLSRRTLAFRKGYGDEASLVYGKYDEYPVNECSVWIVFGLQMIIGFLLTFSVYGCAIFTGHTWNRCEGDSNECLNFDADLAPASLRVGLICIPAFVFFLSVCVTHGY